jgi:tRNA (cmo5U34)-methyltransferase
MRSLDRFNKIAGVYDVLTRTAFGKSLYEAQIFFLSSIPRSSKVLILGGGTGWLLRALLDVNPSCHVWYIEASSSMIELARKKISEAQGHQVHFIHGTENDIPDGMMYDAVVTHFFLDLFPVSLLDGVIGKILEHIRPEAVWLVSDFVYRDKWWQKVMLWLMYLFFRLTCSIDARQLPLWEQRLALHGLDEVKTEPFFGSFIRSIVLRRRTG